MKKSGNMAQYEPKKRYDHIPIKGSMKKKSSSMDEKRLFRDLDEDDEEDGYDYDHNSDIKGESDYIHGTGKGYQAHAVREMNERQLEAGRDDEEDYYEHSQDENDSDVDETPSYDIDKMKSRKSSMPKAHRKKMIMFMIGKRKRHTDKDDDTSEGMYSDI
jgi:hypothetical protein